MLVVGLRPHGRVLVPPQSVANVYDDQDRLTTYEGFTYTYTYKPNGELLTKRETATGNTWTYGYDALGNLLSVSVPNGPQITYLVDGMSRRVAKRVNSIVTKRWLYRDGLSPVAELGAAGKIVARYVYASRPITPDFIVRYGATGTTPVTYRLLSDQLGSPRIAVEVATGAIAFRADYSSFGVQTMLAGAADWITFGFAGGMHDPDTGLVRFGARDYDPVVGRWVSKDPIRFRGGRNLYVYALNDPVNLLDLTGREPTGAGGAPGYGGGGSEGAGGAPWSPSRPCRGIPFPMPFGPSRDEHANRNQNNRCPRTPPTMCGGGNEDDFTFSFGKWRGAQGNECAYDDSGNLLPDPGQTYNFYPDPRTVGHIWCDLGAHFWYGRAGGYTPNLTTQY